MVSLKQGCICCAYCIGGGKTWTQRFRAIYSTPDGVRLSGIGLRNHFEGEFLISTDETARWDTMGDDFIRLSATPEDNRQNAFVFHDTCWGLLREHFNNESIPLERLFEVCGLMPPTIGGDAREYLEQDPCKIAGVRALLHPTKNLPRPSPGVAHLRKIAKNEDDFFGRLPPEIREEIAAYLPTADFYNLRYVSRMMAAIFSSQAFWATRFEVDGDRGFLSYLKKSKTQGR
ncbi:hypothetical protein VTN77DRAFT_4026 [Rasamsonia byssochlamydoides]|uniref:uncharacterized protein n=1 Tax=Rasamsonia byssochlamydoides TaxID=89139 RepID=UPI003743DBD6